jgi:hypothetical protein
LDCSGDHVLRAEQEAQELLAANLKAGEKGIVLFGVPEQ